MALKYKLTKEEFDKLKESHKELYKELNGSYVLDADDPDITNLKAAKDREKEEKKTALSQVAELKKQLEGMQDKLNDKDKDIKYKSDELNDFNEKWKVKHASDMKLLTDKIDEIQNGAKKTLLRNTARALANEISTVPDLLESVIQNKLAVEFHEGEAKVFVMDDDGKKSANSIEDFKKSLVDNPKYSPIIKANNQSGGRTPDKKHSASGQDDPNKMASELTTSEMLARIEAKKGD